MVKGALGQPNTSSKPILRPKLCCNNKIEADRDGDNYSITQMGFQVHGLRKDWINERMTSKKK